VKLRLSVKARVILGAAFWSAGLLVLSSAALVYAIEAHPGAPSHVHQSLRGAWPIVLGLAALVAGIYPVRSGLAGMDVLRKDLGELHAGRASRLGGAYPSEVQPLADDLNALLDRRDRAIDQALARAGDLAHGLKTPLAVIAHDADCAAEAGAVDAAESIRSQVQRMRRQVDYQLAHARAASARDSWVTCDVQASIDGLVRTLTRLHAARALAFDVRIGDGMTVEGRPEDLDEMFGNLLDNACRFARGRIAVTSREDGEHVVVTIDDDGPGLDPALRATVTRRGVRADESGQGAGLGLAIVRDLVELYRGSLVLDQSPLGGLRTEVRLPRRSATSDTRRR
jgi:signal transduction histidine kinase